MKEIFMPQRIILKIHMIYSTIKVRLFGRMSSYSLFLER